MRIPHQEQLQLDATPITELALDTECRDRMIPILRGLQHLYSQPHVRDQALDLIALDVLQDAAPDQGREGLTLWQIFVLAAVRLGANVTYDHLHYLAANDRNLRAMMQVGEWSEESFTWHRIRDNLCLVRPETIEKINQLVVEEGHRLHPEAAEYVRGDTFVAETNVHYPTESGLLLDGLTNICNLAPQLAEAIGTGGWRQSQSLLKKAKRAARAIGRIKQGRNYQQRLQAAYEGLFHFVDRLLPRLESLLDQALGNLPYDANGLLPNCEATALYEQLIYWHSVTEHVRGTAYRRVVLREKVPNVDKLFSLFEPDTELIIRGKAGSPVEFGHKVMVIEDAAGFICHWKVLPIGADERDMLIPELKVLQARLRQRIQRASFDRGFHSPENQTELAKIIPHPCLPKPGVRQGAVQQVSATVEFRTSRRQHSGIESAIGALQSGNGLARCRDHSQAGYARYIGLGILGRNVLLLGKLLLAAEHPRCAAAISLRGARTA
ncbi:MAG: ISNCY family transposase [Pirellulales bacterium]